MIWFACKQCGKEGDWKDFREEERQPYSVCVGCHQVIFWSGTAWGTKADDEGRLDGACGGDNPVDGWKHQPKWLTLAEFRHLTKDLPDSAPLTLYVNDDWQNLRLLPEDVEYYLDESNSSVLLTAVDDFDTRQW